MKPFYPVKAFIVCLLLSSALSVRAQVPTTTIPGICDGVIANFNTSDNGFNSPSIYGSVFDSSFYFHAGRGYWTDYLPPYRVGAPGFPRVMNIISPPFANPNANGTFNVGFYYITNNPFVDRFQVRIISVTSTPQGTVTNVEATSGVQPFASWSTPTPYIDGVTPTEVPVPDPSPFMNGSQGYVCIRLVDPDIQNSLNTNFRVEVSYIVNGPTYAVFDNLSIGPLTIPLPVDFIGLVANRNSNNVSVKWDVGNEIDVKEYHVESSTNGSSFQVAGVIAARGKSIYTYTDENVSPNTIFYRIKSLDLDGKFKYSGIIRLPGSSSSTYADEMLIYPMPAQDNVMIQHKRLSQKARILISTVDGRIMKTIIPANGASHTPVNISGLTPGIYFVKVDDGSGYGATLKLIKN